MVARTTGEVAYAGGYTGQHMFSLDGSAAGLYIATMRSTDGLEKTVKFSIFQ